MNDGKRLLIVDDEPAFAKFLAKAAGSLGYAAVSTTTARDFKAQFLVQAPDVIFLDILMPDQDGIELMRWLVDNGCQARIIICSGYGAAYSKIAKLLGQQNGNLQVSILAKPVRLDELRACLSAPQSNFQP